MSVLKRCLEFGRYSFSQQKRWMNAYVLFIRQTTKVLDQVYTNIHSDADPKRYLNTSGSNRINHLEKKCTDDDEERNKKPDLTLKERVMLAIAMKKSREKKKLGPVITDPSEASSITTQILDNRLIRHAPILELNCGPGLLTRNFLKGGVSTVVGTEKSPDFFHLLEEVQNNFGDHRFKLFKIDPLEIRYKHAEGARKGKRDIDRILLEASSDFDGYCSFVVLAPHVKYRQELVQFILYNIRDDELFPFQKLDIFLTIDDKTLLDIENKNHKIYHRKWSTIVLSLLFDYKVIKTYPVKLFMSLSKRKVKPVRTHFSRNFDPSIVHLTKLKLKDNHEDILPSEYYEDFISFLKLICRSSKPRVIPWMESLVPECGLRLLAEGFSMSSTVQDLEVEQFLQIFKVVFYSQEFHGSPLHEHLASRRGNTTDAITLKNLNKTLKNHR